MNLMVDIFKYQLDLFVIIYQDYILIYIQSRKARMDHIRAVHEILRKKDV